MTICEEKIWTAIGEARRIVAKGVPTWTSIDDLQSEAYMILVENAELDGALLRLRIRGRLLEFLGRESRRIALLAPEDEARSIAAEETDHGFEVLTTKENAVIELLNGGFSEREVADRMKIHKSTVHKIATRALEKLRAQASPTIDRLAA